MCVQVVALHQLLDDPLAAVADGADALQEGGHLLAVLQSQAHCVKMQAELKVRGSLFFAQRMHCAI